MSRVTARLTNAVDEALARRGMLPADQVRSCEVDALVDTETARTVVPGRIAAFLGLAFRREITDVAQIAGPLIVEMHGRDTVDEALVLGDEVRIGQAVLAKLQPTTRV